jgi:3-hydroxyacyl-CoA dehydrogenase
MKPIRNITVLGLGAMGHGIVQAFAAAGFHVRGFDEQKAAVAPFSSLSSGT